MEKKLKEALLVILVVFSFTCLCLGVLLGTQLSRTLSKIERNIDTLDRSVQVAQSLVKTINDLKPFLADSSKFMTSVRSTEDSISEGFEKYHKRSVEG